jgi:hypothetical protein
LVNEPDVAQAKEQLTSLKKAYFSRKQRYQLERDRLATEQKAKERLRDAFSKQHDISLGRDLDEWSRDAKQTASSYLNMATAGVLNAGTMVTKSQDL